MTPYLESIEGALAMGKTPSRRTIANALVYLLESFEAKALLTPGGEGEAEANAPGEVVRCHELLDSAGVDKGRCVSERIAILITRFTAVLADGNPDRYERLEEWLRAPKRKPAASAFTAGADRRIADLVEHVVSTELEAVKRERDAAFTKVNRIRGDVKRLIRSLKVQCDSQSSVVDEIELITNSFDQFVQEEPDYASPAPPVTEIKTSVRCFEGSEGELWVFPGESGLYFSYARDEIDDAIDSLTGISERQREVSPAHALEIRANRPKSLAMLRKLFEQHPEQEQVGT